MQKLVKRLIYDRHTGILNERMDGMLENLRSVVEAGFPAAEQAYKDDLAKWGGSPSPDARCMYFTDQLLQRRSKRGKRRGIRCVGS